MAEGDFVTLRCSGQTLRALATGLARFAPIEGAPGWLISGAWLCCGKTSYIATPSVDVLADGHVARPLSIDPIEDFVARIEAELPDVSARLVAHGNGIELPPAGDPLSPPQSLHDWTKEGYSAAVLVRTSKGASSAHRTACALLFKADTGRSLLVGTDPSVLAMVVSEDDRLIDRYLAGCETISLPDYLEACGS